MPTSKKLLIGLGLLSVGMGTVPFLTGLGLVASGTGASGASPRWVAVLAGLLFAFAGMAVILKALTGAGDLPGSRPSGARRSLRFAYDLIILAMAGSLAAIASWVAFGEAGDIFPDRTNFGASVADAGRTMFGFGAMLTWFVAGVLLLYSVRRWFSRR